MKIRISKEDIITTLLSVFLCAAIAVCVVSLCYSVIIFSYSQRQFSKEYSAVILAIEADIASPSAPNVEESTTALAEQSLPEPQTNPSINNEQSKTENTLDSKIAYLKELQALQKSSSSNDVIIFLYSFLSSVLVGTGVTLVEKAKKSSDKATLSATAAESVAKSAETSATNATDACGKAEENYRESKRILDAAKMIAEDARRSHERLLDTIDVRYTVLRSSDLLIRFIDYYIREANDNDFLKAHIENEIVRVNRVIKSAKNKIDKLDGNTVIPIVELETLDDSLASLLSDIKEALKCIDEFVDKAQEDIKPLLTKVRRNIDNYRKWMDSSAKKIQSIKIRIYSNPSGYSQE